MQEWIRFNQKWRRKSAHNIIHSFFKRSRAANSVVGDGIWQKFKLIQGFIVAIVTCKNEQDSIKNESTRVLTTFLPLKVYGDFFRRSRVANSADPCPILPNFEPIQAFIAVIVTCKNKEGPMKNGSARVLTRFFPL